MRICRENLPQLFAVALPWGFTAAVCCGNLPQLFAVSICGGYLPWVSFVYVNEPYFYVSEFFFFVSKLFLIESKPSLYESKTFFIYENFIFNSVSFCYCRGVYGPP